MGSILPRQGIHSLANSGPKRCTGIGIHKKMNAEGYPGIGIFPGHTVEIWKRTGSAVEFGSAFVASVGKGIVLSEKISEYFGSSRRKGSVAGSIVREIRCIIPT